jgi:hypothetical protein
MSKAKKAQASGAARTRHVSAPEIVRSGGPCAAMIDMVIRLRETGLVYLHDGSNAYPLREVCSGECFLLLGEEQQGRWRAHWLREKRNVVILPSTLYEIVRHP